MNSHFGAHIATAEFVSFNAMLLGQQGVLEVR
jgi:hypothetical protein